MQFSVISMVGLVATVMALPAFAQSADPCGELVTLATRGKTGTSYSLVVPPKMNPEMQRIALVLLPGGPGFVDLDTRGCPRKLKGNSLVRSLPLFHRHGFVTALVDASSDHRGEDGLGGFRISPLHAEDLGKVIADLRNRTKLPVWIVGTSRGTISAVNAVSRLVGAEAPDGLVLTSAVTSGREGGRKPWVSQTVFSLRLEAIRVPVLVVAHAADTCIRTPPGLAGKIATRTNGVRKQTVMVTGGPGGGHSSAPGVGACEGRSPHGFIGQEAEVAAGLARFIRGGTY